MAGDLRSLQEAGIEQPIPRIPPLCRSTATLEIVNPRLVPIEDVEQLKRLLTTPDRRPLLLFKHSRSCGASAQALDELDGHLRDRATDARYAIVMRRRRHSSFTTAASCGAPRTTASPQTPWTRRSTAFSRVKA